MKEADVSVRHVTRPGSNLFRELGFPPAEARRLQAISRRQIEVSLLLKQQLMQALADWIVDHGLKQHEAAAILMVSRPRVSDVVNKKAARFTLDALVDMLGRIGKRVTLSIG